MAQQLNLLHQRRIDGTGLEVVVEIGGQQVVEVQLVDLQWCVQREFGEGGRMADKTEKTVESIMTSRTHG